MLVISFLCLIGWLFSLYFSLLLFYLRQKHLRTDFKTNVHLTCVHSHFQLLKFAHRNQLFCCGSENFAKTRLRSFWLCNVLSMCLNQSSHSIVFYLTVLVFGFLFLFFLFLLLVEQHTKKSTWTPFAFDKISIIITMLICNEHQPFLHSYTLKTSKTHTHIKKQIALIRLFGVYRWIYLWIVGLNREIVDEAQLFKQFHFVLLCTRCNRLFITLFQKKLFSLSLSIYLSLSFFLFF